MNNRKKNDDQTTRITKDGRQQNVVYQHSPRSVDGKKSQPNTVQTMEVVVRGCQNLINHLGGAAKRRWNSYIAILPERRWIGIVLLFVIGVHVVVNLK